MVLLDACVRLLPGVMGAADSAAEESFADGLLEYPHYTRPADWQGRAVPDVLLSGHHAAIAAWRRARGGTDHPRAPARSVGMPHMPHRRQLRRPRRTVDRRERTTP